MLRDRRHLLVALFATITAIELAHHEMWLDELNPWVIARDARSLRDLFYNVRFEPHPRLWYLCLFALTRLTRNPAAMQAFHGAIATASVALIAYRSPFRSWDAWLIAFGYYLVFEYCGISRGYALGIFFALATCALATSCARLILPALLLVCLANTSLFGAILAGSLALALAPLARMRPAREAAVAVLILIAGMAVSVWALVPSPDNAFGRDRFLRLAWSRADYVSSFLGRAYVPLPDVTNPNPWNSSLLETGGRHIPYVGHFAGLIVGGVVFALAIVHLRRKPALVAALAAGSVAMLILIYVEYSGGYRHHGHLFVLLLLVLWLAAASSPPAGRRVPAWLAGVLATHVAAGLYFVALDVVRPFSAQRDVAGFFAAAPSHIPIVVAQPHFLSYAGPPLSAYLRHRVYYAVPGGVVRGSYLVYDEARARGASEDEIDAEIGRFARDLGTDVFVVASHWEPHHLGTPIAAFRRDTIEGDERGTAVYLVKKPQ